LRRSGFVPDWDSVAGGERCWQWSRTIGDRQVTVQLWGDGNHRATHGIRGSEDTLPTEFKDTTGMMDAISHEWHRADNKRALRGREFDHVKEFDLPENVNVLVIA
jgi:hypothetical protein